MLIQCFICDRKARFAPCGLIMSVPLSIPFPNSSLDWDYFDSGTPGSLADGQRAATVLMYLSDVESGGETCFHDGKWLKEEVQKPKVRGCFGGSKS